MVENDFAESVYTRNVGKLRTEFDNLYKSCTVDFPRIELKKHEEVANREQQWHNYVKPLLDAIYGSRSDVDREKEWREYVRPLLQEIYGEVESEDGTSASATS